MEYRSGKGFKQQPIDMVDGVVRFRENKVVRYLLDNGSLSLDDLSSGVRSREDWEQFAQLIGYSVNCFGELPYVSDSAVVKADKKARKIANRTS